MPTTDRDISTHGDEADGYHETDFHGSRGEQPYHNTRVQIAGDEWALGNVVEVERLRRRYAHRYRILMESLNDTTRRGILAALVQREVTTYEELSKWVHTTARTVKTHVHALRDAEVVVVEDGRPAAISFLNDDLRLLASDVLSFC